MGKVTMLVACGLLAVFAASAPGSRGRASGAGGTTARRVVVGPGIAEDTVRQVIRTRGNVVYVFAPDDTAQRGNAGPAVIRAYRATTPGSPRAFVEADADHHPSSTGTHVLYAPDVRLDRRGVAHMVYVDQATGDLVYDTFSTVTDTWGAPSRLGDGAPANPGFYSTPTRVYRNWASYGLVLDGLDRPHVVYCSGDDVYARTRSSGTWSTPQLVGGGTTPIHVQLAADRASNIYATWLDNPLGEPGSTAVMYAEQSARTGAWTKPEVVDKGSPNVLGNATDDQGPSLVLTASNVPYVLYLSGRTDAAGKAITTASVRSRRHGRWLDESPPSVGYRITHSPQIYGRGNDIYVFLGHDAAIHWGVLVRRAGRAWSPYTVLDSTSRMDGSVSVRWDPQRDGHPGVIDAVHHSEDVKGNGAYLPQLYYQAVMPARK